MAERDAASQQAHYTNGSESTGLREKVKDPGRRQFVSRALAVSAGVALSGFLPHLKAAPQAGQSCTVKCNDQPFQPGENCGLPFENPGEIRSGSDGMLHAVLRVVGEQRRIPYWDVRADPKAPACSVRMLRAYEGYRGKKVDPSQRVTKPGVYGPGPTFRAQVGDTIQIALLNHLDPQLFPETLDGSCTSVIAPDGTVTYPAPPDTAPNCFRGGNTTNMHFHGTHVTPNCWGDNVLVNVVPDLKANPEQCQSIFDICKDATCPDDWKHHHDPRLQTFLKWRDESRKRLGELNSESQLHKKQLELNRALEEENEFDEYWAGCFPYCITPPKWEPQGKYEMGQAPGTHWYHAHKHGSTSIQLFNGMAGALILEGDYDKKLKETMPGVVEQVIVLQQFQVQPNREGAKALGPGGAPEPLVNGQLRPVIKMKPGEVQWWRIINATVQSVGRYAFVNTKFFKQGQPIPPFRERGKVPLFRQTAQDGVQLAWKNYNSMQHRTDFILAPGNRMDILVKAPTEPGAPSESLWAFESTNPPANPEAGSIILHVVVERATAQIKYNQKWPDTEAEYPVMPDFLGDIYETTEGKTLKYQMAGIGEQPMINDKPFRENHVDETMTLGTSQEWRIENYSTVSTHPFHIHVNPFQIVEIFDPNQHSAPVSLPRPWVWWDTFALPLAKDVNGAIVPGYIKMHTRFVDFPGKFVDHCHILAHEDRGMMQLIQVVDTHTAVQHH